MTTAADAPVSESPADWFSREWNFAVDAHEMTSALESEVRTIFDAAIEDGDGWRSVGDWDQYARAAQLIACRRMTCGGPNHAHEHISQPGGPASMTAAGPVAAELHYHVLAVQDAGGTQESWRGWDEKRTLADAEQLARDAIEADRPMREGWNEDDFVSEEHTEARLRARYGDDWRDLRSGNVAPGWEAIYIRPCQQVGECDVYADISSRYAGNFPEPWWTPSRGECNPELIPLPS